MGSALLSESVTEIVLLTQIVHVEKHIEAVKNNSSLNSEQQSITE